jgi:hypothetical protein
MVKFFALVSRAPAYGLAVLAAVTVLGVVTTWLNPREIDSSLGMVLFVHMLLASSGFAPSARRGHFDPVLVRGRNRQAALAAQWCASIAPGAVAWTLVAVTGVLFDSSAGTSALAGSRVVAFWIVSAVAWSIGFLLPRGAGGALWIGLLIVLLLWHADLLARGASQDTAVAVLRTAATLVLCPFLLLGPHVPVGLPATAAALAMSGAVLFGTWRAGSRLDVYLVERS